MTRALVFALLVGCSPAATRLTVDHPAHPDAPAGRLAGPPPALRPGVVDAPKQPATPPAAPEGHEGHH